MLVSYPSSAFSALLVVLAQFDLTATNPLGGCPGQLPPVQHSAAQAEP